MVGPKRKGVANEIMETIGRTVRIFERSTLHLAKICGMTTGVAAKASTKAVDRLFSTHVAVLRSPERIITLSPKKSAYSTTKTEATVETANPKVAEETPRSGKGKTE